MNEIKGVIKEIDSYEGISIVTIGSKKNIFKSIILEDPSSMDYLKIGNPVKVLFKETEVIIVKADEYKISLRNRLKCTIISIDKGVLLSTLKLDFNDGVIHSIITSEAVEKLRLKPGDAVTAMIKTNEIMIAE